VAAALVEVRGLALGYEGRTTLRNVDLRVKEGECWLVLGHNGAGKTTLVRSIFGLIPPMAGTIRVLGHDVPPAGPRDLVRAGGRYLAQGPRSFDELSVGEHRSVLCRLHGFVGAGERASSPAARQRVGDLSVGMRRREALELLLPGRPRLLVLDEPTASLDPASTGPVIRWLGAMRVQGISLIVVEQAIEPLLGLADGALVLRSGEMTYSGPAAALRDRNELARVFL